LRLLYLLEHRPVFETARRVVGFIQRPFSYANWSACFPIVKLVGFAVKRLLVLLESRSILSFGLCDC
jgi:hypothetical protein